MLLLSYDGLQKHFRSSIVCQEVQSLIINWTAKLNCGSTHELRKQHNILAAMCLTVYAMLDFFSLSGKLLGKYVLFFLKKRKRKKEREEKLAKGS